MKKVKFTSYKPQVKAKFKRAVAGTLEALGMKWQEIVVREINTQPRFGHALSSKRTKKGKRKKRKGEGAVDTGKMHSSMKYKVNRKKQEVTVGSNLNYALYVTYGTRKMPRRPFFQNSGFNYDKQYKAVIKGVMQRLMK